MINTPKENHVAGTKFNSAFVITFSYTSLSNRLKTKGWVCVWHKVTSPESLNEDVSVPLPSWKKIKFLPLSYLRKEEKRRMNLSVSKQVSSKWQSFISAKCRQNDYIRILNEAALNEYMETNKNTHFMFLSE